MFDIPYTKKFNYTSHQPVMKVNMTLKKHQRERFEYIETRLLWGEGLTASELSQVFDISRPIAQKVITDYRERHPNQMIYQSSQKRHIASNDFEPLYIKVDPLKFLDYLRGSTLIGLYREERDWSEFEVTDVSRLLHPDLTVSVIQKVLSALNRKQTVYIEYKTKALESGKWTSRVISPNHLVYANNRYHIRAYCHFKCQFLDFVLSRIKYAEINHEDWVPSHEDEEWNENIKLAFKPNPELSQGVQNAIIHNFKTVNSGIKIVSCRKALAFYVEREMLSIDNKYGRALWVKCQINE